MKIKREYLKYLNALEKEMNLYRTTESKISNMTNQEISDYSKWLNIIKSEKWHVENNNEGVV